MGLTLKATGRQDRNGDASVTGVIGQVRPLACHFQNRFHSGTTVLCQEEGEGRSESTQCQPSRARCVGVGNQGRTGTAGAQPHV